LDWAVAAEVQGRSAGLGRRGRLQTGGV